jgi:ATP-dependent helicase HrpB
VTISPLPIDDLRADLQAACRAHRRLIIQAPTGSGKSTRIPQFLLDDGILRDGRVIVLQPRRLATRLLASRVADERHVPLGLEVGYQIRFEDVSNDRTRIKFETEGILLRQLLSDPELREVDAILFDEFHERHLYADITLARALQLQRTSRPDLLLIIMSATLDPDPLQTYLGDCALLRSEGRTYPVDIRYLPRAIRTRDETVMDAAVAAMEKLIREDAPGDALIFMPGAYEIQKTIQGLRASSACSNCLILPLHGELPPQEQDAAVARYDRRKIIVSTNVAETSLTIDGIRIVIDAGLARIPRFDPHRSINTLWIEKISRAAADQRAGRAGRTAPGLCVRLWTEQEHRERALQEIPEIRRVDLSEALLTLKAAGLDDFATFPWFEAPDPAALDKALRLLVDLGALTATDQHITAIGTRMASFPLHPRYARMMLAAADYQCVRQVALVAALTQGRSILVRRTGKDVQQQQAQALGESAASDFFILMRAWQFARSNHFDVGRCRAHGIHAQSARQVERVYDSFIRLAERQGLPVNTRAGDDENLCKCVLAGFADQVALRRDRGTRICRLVHGRTGVLASESVIDDAPLLVAAEIDEIQSGHDAQVRLNLATRIEENWLEEIFPDAIQTKATVLYDPSIKRVVQEVRRQYHDLVLEAKRTGEPAADAAARLLADEVDAGRLSLNHWDAQVEQWILRLNALAGWCPDLGLPVIGTEERRLLIEQLCLGCFSFKEARNQPVWPIVKSMLQPHQLHVLAKEAPEKLDIGGKRSFRLMYTEQSAPYLSARIQELFGVRDVPAIACGRVKPIVHILAPNQRPVQITQDLAGFWETHYPGIRKELKRKYPKHAWPEDPRQSATK